MLKQIGCISVVLLLMTLIVKGIYAQGLEAELQKESIGSLIQASAELGDPARGAIVFHQPTSTCAQCHNTDDESRTVLGPDLSQLSVARDGKPISDTELVEAILKPSQFIDKKYRSVIVATGDGETLTGIVVSENDQQLELREGSPTGKVLAIAKEDVEAIKENPLSIMPAGLMNSLQTRQQFLDLVKYLMTLREGGRTKAIELKPSAALLAVRIPEYENHLDHAGLISSWDDESLKRGEAIYTRVCANCHGTKDQPGSLPTSLRFAEGKFKNGADPLSMYRTLTRGYGFMVAQTWMVPSQKYDVIHFIRERYLKPHNPSQYAEVNDAYLASLPAGDTKGPAASQIEAWVAMDYGPSLTHTYEVPGEKENFAYKGIAIRLDQGGGGVSRGKHWSIFDTDTLRMAASWRHGGKEQSPFIDWRGIQFNGEHQIHPKVSGDVRLSNSTGPGWGKPSTLELVDNERVEGRDGKRYGPLPKTWGKFLGYYYHDQKVVLKYQVGSTAILEYPTMQEAKVAENEPWLVRHFQIGPRQEEMLLRVMDSPTTTTSSDGKGAWKFSTGNEVLAELNVEVATKADAANFIESFTFDNTGYLQVDEVSGFDPAKNSVSIVARIKTKQDGTILAWTEPGPKWIPNGETLFIRDGRLGFDIGWVGAVAGRTNIDDGKWHVVRCDLNSTTGQVQLFVDGKPDGRGVLQPQASLAAGLIRIGYTAPNFPETSSFVGEVDEVRIYNRVLSKNWTWDAAADESLIARWQPKQLREGSVENAATVNGKLGAAKIQKIENAQRFSPAQTMPWSVAVKGDVAGLIWVEQDGMLCLKIPAGKETRRLAVMVRAAKDEEAELMDGVDFDLASWTTGGPKRFGEPLVTELQTGEDDGPFAVDNLLAPDGNPWLALTRFTGLDFLPDGRMAVCTWDGDVWLVKIDEDEKKLYWKRIASGMFQPLGLKVVQGSVYVTCRDQLTRLHDLNGDEEIDFYECFNNDHQVTEHFHEFAMGLQVDADGNFYYAKSGRHALKAVVPHHGTLLKVSPDGETTTILATGFRAANGVCLNPDGSFVVTDQEGFWNPKNRINWVTVPKDGSTKFYGNMFGYHSVTDDSDAAMEPPLCWITNEFDRSPAELLWVKSKSWGALDGALLNLSYGYGRVFVVPHENVQGKVQGGMVSLPIPDFPTGVMRGRFSESDGALYLCGMFAWAGNATEPGGLYRLKATGKAMNLPTELHAQKNGLRLRFTDALDAKSVDPKNVQIKVWSLKRTANYGSQHYDEHALTVADTELSTDGKELLLKLPDIAPTWCMEIRYQFRNQRGEVVRGVVHNTVHALSEE